MKAGTYRKYLLGILLAIYAFNYADRFAVGIALQDIKGTLHLSDTELGLLTGIAFAAFYALVGIPIARWTDRGNRVAVIGVTVTVWSVMVAVTGRALSFTQLLLVRVGVAVGDAGIVPAAQSLIPDYFSRAERPRACAVFLMGASVAFLLGYFAAGWCNQFFGWRVMFLLIGLPGFVLASLAWLTLEEPRLENPPQNVHSGGAAAGRGDRAGPPTAGGANNANLIEVLGTLWRNTTYRHLLKCAVVTSFFTVGVTQWQPSFFMRSFGMHSGDVGTWLAITMGVGSFVSIYVGGASASRYAANNEALQLQIATLGYLFVGVAYSIAYLSGNPYVVFGMIALSSIINAIGGPLAATIQNLVPPRMRATSYAVLLLLSNLIGLGLGPLAAGALSDALHPLLGEESLRYALLAMSPGYVWSAWYMWRASTTVRHDLAAGDEHFSGSSPDCM